MHFFHPKKPFLSGFTPTETRAHAHTHAHLEDVLLTTFELMRMEGSDEQSELGN